MCWLNIQRELVKYHDSVYRDNKWTNHSSTWRIRQQIAGDGHGAIKGTLEGAIFANLPRQCDLAPGRHASLNYRPTPGDTEAI